MKIFKLLVHGTSVHCSSCMAGHHCCQGPKSAHLSQSGQAARQQQHGSRNTQDFSVFHDTAQQGQTLRAAPLQCNGSTTFLQHKGLVRSASFLRSGHALWHWLLIDGESGDELEDLPDSVGRSDAKSPKRSKKRRKKGKLGGDQHEVAVGSDAGDAEEMSSFADEFAEFEDEGYDPSIAPDNIHEDHQIEVEEIPEDGGGGDNDDVMDVDEEDGAVRLSKRGTLLKLEEAFLALARVSCPLPENLKLAILSRCITGQFKTYINGHLDAGAPLDILREAVLRFDRATTKWSSTTVLGQDYPTLMEVDRIKGKEKGKKGTGKQVKSKRYGNDFNLCFQQVKIKARGRKAMTMVISTRAQAKVIIRKVWKARASAW